jgi:hypothetical protein
MTIKNDVLDVLADMSTASKVMVAIHQTVKQIVSIAPCGNHQDLNWSQINQFTVDGITTVGNVRNIASSIAIAPDYRQPNKLALFEFSQHRTAGHILEQALVCAPVPQLAQFPGQPGTMPVGIVGDESTNQLQIIRQQLTPLNSQVSAHERQYSKILSKSPVLFFKEQKY